MNFKIAVILIVFFVLSSCAFAARELDCNVDDCTDLIAYYKMNEAAGDAVDSSGNGNDASSTVPDFNSSCKYDGCFDFDGSDDVVIIPEDDSLKADSVTVSVWYNYDLCSGTDDMIDFYTTNNGYSMTCRNAGFRTTLGNGSAQLQTLKGMGTSAGTWYHMLFTYNGSDLIEYLDGDVFFTNSTGLRGPLDYGSGDLSIGTSSLDGKLDCVQVWNKSLNITEVKNVHYSTTCNDAGDYAGQYLDIIDSSGDNDMYTGGSSYADENSSACYYDGGCREWVRTENTAIQQSAYSESLDIANNVTWSYWIKVDDVTGGDIMVRTSNINFNGIDHSVGAYDASFRFTHNVTTACSEATGIDFLNDFGWHHVAGTKNTTGLYIYTDGILRANDTSSNCGLDIGSTTAPFKLAQRTSTFDGHLQCVQVFNSSLSPADIANLNNSATCNSSFDPSLVSTWKLDDADVSVDTTDNLVSTWDMNSWEKTVEDSTGSNDGDIGAWYNTSGRIGYAKQFDGVDDYLLVDNNQALHSAETLTVMAWIKRDVLGDDTIIDAYNVNDLKKGYQLHIENTDNDPDWIVGNGSDNSIASYVTTINAGEWYHVAGTMNGSHSVLYLDGQEVGATPFVGEIQYSTGYDTYIGTRNGVITEYFGGLIDEVSIWNRSLNSSQILQLYNAGAMPVSNNTGFTGGDTTDFANAPDLSAVANPTLHVADHAKIKWNSGSMDVANKDFDSYVAIHHDGSGGMVSIDAAALGSAFNTSANITVYNVNCADFRIYHSPIHVTSYFALGAYGEIVATQDNSTHLGGSGNSSILSGDSEPYAQNINCAAGILTYTALHFDGTGGGGEPESVPEFSDLGWVLMMVIVVGGFLAVRRKDLNS